MMARHYILAFLLIINAGAFAQGVRFTASVSKTIAGTGEEFEISFSVNSNADNFTPPDFRGFQVLAGPNVSSSMTSINGNMSSSTSYSYYLMPVKEGTYTIGPAAISVNGRTIRSNAVQVRVVKGRPVPRSGQQAQAAPPDEDIIESRPAKLSNSIFLRTVADKTNVFHGQQITVSYKLYTRVSIVASQVDKLPDLNGFWSEDVKTDNQNAEWTTETYKGQKYHVATVKKTILFSDHAGNLTIDPLQMTFVVRQAAPARTLMDEFFGTYEDVKYKVKSLPLTIHVKPLPEAGKPQDFTGAVGNFTIAASADKKELKANEALNYSFKISGSGNLKLLKAPLISFPPDFEKYDPKITDAISVQESGVSGSRSYNYLLIPRHEGDYAIEAQHFSYFNPSTGKYVKLSTPSFPVRVNKGNPADNQVYTSADKQDVKLLNKDIRYIKTGDPELYKEGEEFYGSFLFYILLLLGPLAFAGALWYRNWHRKNNADPVLVKSRKAAKLAAKHLANAEKQLTANRGKEFYEDISRGLYGYLSDKLNIPSADLSKERIAADLRSQNVNDETIGQLTETLSLCEMARFAPITGISAEEVFEKAKSTIYAIESNL